MLQFAALASFLHVAVSHGIYAACMCRQLDVEKKKNTYMLPDIHMEL